MAQRAAEPARPARGGGRAGGQNVITTEGGAARVRQTVTEEGGRTWIDLEVTADADLDIPGVYYTFDLPSAEFSAAARRISRQHPGAQLVSLPVHKPAAREFFTGAGSEIAFTGAHDLRFTISLDHARPIALGIGGTAPAAVFTRRPSRCMPAGLRRPRRLR